MRTRPNGHTISEGFIERTGPAKVVGRPWQPKTFRRWLADRTRSTHREFANLRRHEAAEVLRHLERASATIHGCSVAQLRQRMLSDLGLPPMSDAEFERVYVEGL